MPTYVYECARCGGRFELLQGISDPPRQRCPQCRGKVKRLILPGGGLIFKGSGFYITDYKRREAGASEGAPAASETGGPAGKEGEPGVGTGKGGAGGPGSSEGAAGKGSASGRGRAGQGRGEGTAPRAAPAKGASSGEGRGGAGSSKTGSSGEGS
ncbi:MAG: hypothetical protein FJY75_01170 [Candidatus Eisenbacteria bacterium]|uniref:Putative regulatory protein FmdB zinc ribbon domain-containing protein n=1 Tax=Eiseniibacteriota bacterium TaxID=2212470 RepID=A0A938BPP8_UNCEI|nr:hypothetical protein [Candidatus Eisenbacteria bacterium]